MRFCDEHPGSSLRRYRFLKNSPTLRWAVSNFRNSMRPFSGWGKNLETKNGREVENMDDEPAGREASRDEKRRRDEKLKIGL